jgi:inosose dehydratase
MPSGFRLAAAPITWGVCEVPGWGHQMTPQRVLAEMTYLGFAATEAGPDGFLPDDPDQVRADLDEHRLQLAAGFVPVVLHDARRWDDERQRASQRIETLGRAGAEVAVAAAATGTDGYEERPELDESEWARLFDAVAELEEIAGRVGMSLTVHPHCGTVIETPDQIERFLEASDAPICLDTGHSIVGGGDPVELARMVPERIRHVHLKDVDLEVAARVRMGEISYHQATADGLYRVLGKGDLDVAAILEVLHQTGFEGWLVLEHDIVLAEEPPTGAGPRQDAEASLRHLESVVTTVES